MKQTDRYELTFYVYDSKRSLPIGIHTLTLLCGNAEPLLEVLKGLELYYPHHLDYDFEKVSVL